MKKKILLSLLFLISLTPMFLSQFGGGRGVQELPGYISLLNPIGIISVVIYFCGIWCDFKITKLKNIFSIVGLSGIIVSEIYEFLTWYIFTITGEFSIQHSLRFVFPEFYFGLFISVAMLVCYIVIEHRYKK